MNFGADFGTAIMHGPTRSAGKSKDSRMTASEQRPRADLAALRIQRDDDEDRGTPVGKIVGWVIAVAAIGALAFAAYARYVVPRRAPVVEIITVKPSILVANPALLTATGYLVAERTAKITPKISGKVVQLNVDTGQYVRKGDVLAVLESTNLRALLDEAEAALGEAEREYNRQAALWQQGVTSRALLDSAEAQLKG